MNSGAGAAPNLSPAHAALLAQYRIPPDLLAAAGVRGATDTEVRDALGFNAHRGCDLSGLLFPLRHPRTADHLGAWVRLNSPPTGCGKYLQPRGCRRLYVPPLPAEWLDDPAVPAVIVEGPKSALALLALAQRRGRSLVPIATGGCWGWRRNDGFRELPGGGHEPVTAPSPMFDLLEWQGRKAVLALDGDARANPGVAAARRALASELAGRGASVRIAAIPPEAGEKAGPDDVLAACGDEAALAMLDAARPWAECARAEAEAAIKELEANRKADPLPAVEAVAAVSDPARRPLLIGQIATLKIPGLTKAEIGAQCARLFAEAQAQRQAAAEAARRGKLLGMAVDGAAMLDDLLAFSRRFVRATEAELTAVTLAIVNTHVFRAAMYCPIVHVTSPAPACGKSRLLEVARLFVWQPWLTGRTTVAALVSKCAEGCTLLLDEADTALEQSGEYVAALRAVLDCRFEADKPASLKVPSANGGWEHKNCDVFGPTFIAGIGRLPDTVASRALTITLQRQPRGVRVEKFRKRKVGPEAAALRERIEAWGAQRYESLCGAEPALPEMVDRQEDFCEPLLGIADAAGGGWPERARKALAELCAAAALQDDSIGAKLLADVKAVMDDRQADRIASKDLAEALGAMEDRPWAEWGRAQKPITAPQVARQLGRFGIVPRTIRQPDGSTPKGYLREALAPEWERYLPPGVAAGGGPSDATSPCPPIPNRHTATRPVNTGENRDFAAATETACGGVENGVSPNKDAGCGGVAARNQEDSGGACQGGLFGATPNGRRPPVQEHIDL